MRTVVIRILGLSYSIYVHGRGLLLLLYLIEASIITRYPSCARHMVQF